MKMFRRSFLAIPLATLCPAHHAPASLAAANKVVERVEKAARVLGYRAAMQLDGEMKKLFV